MLLGIETKFKKEMHVRLVGLHTAQNSAKDAKKSPTAPEHVRKSGGQFTNGIAWKSIGCDKYSGAACPNITTHSPTGSDRWVIIHPNLKLSVFPNKASTKAYDQSVDPII